MASVELKSEPGSRVSVPYLHSLIQHQASSICIFPLQSTVGSAGLHGNLEETKASARKPRATRDNSLGDFVFPNFHGLAVAIPIPAKGVTVPRCD